MNQEKTKVHFTDKLMISPTNPITVNVVGAGGTGSKLMTALHELNHSLIALEHAGLSVRLWDDDVVTQANLGRQRFAESELGLHKSVAIINRINRWAGTDWKAETRKFQRDSFGAMPKHARASIYISCVDNVASRFEIADILKELNTGNTYADRPRYWLDFGNGKHSGQVLLSTVGTIAQPNSKLYQPQGNLPFITDEYGELLLQSEQDDDTPSCSLAEALDKQDLYINASLVQMGCSLLWSLFRNGLTPYRGFFHNLKDFSTQPVRIG